MGFTFPTYPFFMRPILFQICIWDFRIIEFEMSFPPMFGWKMSFSPIRIIQSEHNM